MNLNKSMKMLIEENKVAFPQCNFNLEASLEDILSGGITQISDCYFLAKLTHLNFNVDEAIEQSFDKTQLECEINHIHVGDYLNHPAPEGAYLLEQGLCYAVKLQGLLHKINGFEIILAYVKEPILDCNIRFHKKRPKEEWLIDDLEKYDEAVLVLE